MSDKSTSVTPPNVTGAVASPSKLKETFETLLPISLACAVTAGVMYPVDVVRALKMASASGPNISIQDFVKTHGLKGVMTQGVVPEILRATWMRVLKFFFFPVTFEALYHKPTSKGTPLEKALAGAIAVTPEVATITTLELAKIGLQTDAQNKYHNSIRNLAGDVYKHRGATGLMAGWQGVQMRQMLWTGTYFATLDSFKGVCRSIYPGEVVKSSFADNAVNFFAGFLAGVAGAAANTPADVVRTTIQRQCLSNLQDQTRSTFRDAFDFTKMITVGKDIVAQKGVGSLYNGFAFKALHMGGSGACVALLIPLFGKMLGIQKDLM